MFAVAMMAMFVLVSVPAYASSLVFSQGFEVDTAGWFDSSNGGYGTVTRVASGSNGVPSSSGGFHAEMVQDNSAAPFTRYGGYSSVWPNGFTTSADFYLDTMSGIGAGFDFSSAVSNTAGLHRRDFIFHVGMQNDGSLRVAASNNTNFNTRMDLGGLNNLVVGASGWYTFQHRFYDMGGVLAVDMVVLQGNTELFSHTLSDGSDLIGGIGGNRYGWLTHTDGLNNVAVDNVSLTTGTSDVPEPTTLLLLGLGLAGGVARRFKRQ